MIRMEAPVCDFEGSISCPVIRPPPRKCVDLPSFPSDVCTCTTGPPRLPVIDFPEPTQCSTSCIVLAVFIPIIIISLIVILCILTCYVGKDEKPRKKDKPSARQRCAYYWMLFLFYNRFALKRVFGEDCPGNCRAILKSIGKQKPDSDEAVSENTERSPASKHKVDCSDDTERGQTECIDDLEVVGEQSAENRGDSHEDKQEECLPLVPKETESCPAKSPMPQTEPVQLETRKAPASPTARTCRVGPTDGATDGNNGHSPTQV